MPNVQKLMRNKIYFFLFIFLQIFILSSLCFTKGFMDLPEFNKEDNILILAPHPDDESIGTAGVIQEALKAGAKVKLVCFTNGDHNELAFIIYEKRIVVRKGEFIYMGEVRRKESISAMDSLGLGQDNVIFLGYPDFGTLEILTKYWGDTKPFKDILTRIDKVPYPEALSPKAPYVGESILKDLKTVILDFKPTRIFVSHPVDSNRDHRSLYLFLKIALWDLEGKIQRPQIFPYLVHVVGWPKPRGFHPDLRLEPPDLLKASNISWEILNLTQEEINAKKHAIEFYKSQIKYDPPYLFTFARENELFGDYPVIKLKEQNTEEIQWQDVETVEWEEEGYKERSHISNLAYAYKSKDLLVKLILKHKMDKEFGISIFLLGYRKNKNFSEMPKIHINMGIEGFSVRDKKQILFFSKVQMSHEGNTFILRIPLDLLSNPEYLLACARTNIKDFTLDDTAWRIIELD